MRILYTLPILLSFLSSHANAATSSILIDDFSSLGTASTNQASITGSTLIDTAFMNNVTGTIGENRTIAVSDFTNPGGSNDGFGAGNFGNIVVNTAENRIGVENDRSDAGVAATYNAGFEIDWGVGVNNDIFDQVNVSNANDLQFEFNLLPGNPSASATTNFTFLIVDNLANEATFLASVLSSDISSGGTQIATFLSADGGFDGNNVSSIIFNTNLESLGGGSDNSSNIDIGQIDLVGVPEPSSTSLLALTSLSLILRRKRVVFT